MLSKGILTVFGYFLGEAKKVTNTVKKLDKIVYTEIFGLVCTSFYTCTAFC